MGSSRDRRRTAGQQRHRITPSRRRVGGEGGLRPYHCEWGLNTVDDKSTSRLDTAGTETETETGTGTETETETED